MEYCQYLPQNFLIFIAPSLLFPNWWNVLRIYGGGQMEFSRREYKGDRTALEWLLLKSFPWETKMWEIRQKEIFKDLNKYCSALVEHFKDLIQRMSHFEVCTSYSLQTMALMLSMVSHIKANATLMLMTMTMIMFLTMSHCWEECYSGLQWVELFSIYGCTDLTDVENIPKRTREYILRKKSYLWVLLELNLPHWRKKTEIFGGDEQKKYYHRWR